MRQGVMKIKDEVVSAIIRHAQKNTTIEACGYLAGHDDVITTHYEMTNVDHSAEHFSLDPKEQFTVLRNAREKGLTIYAVYHSHPHTPARPSAEDKKLASDPHMCYAIVSLAYNSTDVKFFKIKDSEIEYEDVEVITNE